MARARSRLVDEAIATMNMARALFDELARKRPGDSEVRKGRVDALVGFHWRCLASLSIGAGVGLPTSRPWHRKRPTTFTPIFPVGGRMTQRSMPPDAKPCQVADLRRQTSHWGETYSALEVGIEPPRGLAGASAGRPVDQSTSRLWPKLATVR